MNKKVSTSEAYKGTRRRVYAPHDPVSMTEQEHKDDVDIRNIVQRAKATRQPPTIGFSSNRKPMFGDFFKFTGLGDAYTKIIEADRQFAALPSKIRERFRNQPRLLLQFLQNPDNLAEARELGLVPPEPKKEKPAKPAPEGKKPPQEPGTAPPKEGA